VIKNYLYTLILSIVPISELRGAIPFAYFNDISIFLALVISIIGNCLVYPICNFFLNHINNFFCKHIKRYNIFYKKFRISTSKKIQNKINKYGYLGLMIFVGIPLPITGAWTATFGSWFLGLDKKKSFWFISLGILMSGIIVSTFLFLGIGINSIFIKKL